MRELSITQMRENMNVLEGICKNVMPTPQYLKWLDLFSKLLSPRQHEGRVYPGLLHAPGSVAAHHSHEGGLVLHLLEMWHFAKIIPSPGIDPKDVLIGILTHDLHKASYNYMYKDGCQPTLVGVETKPQRFEYTNHIVAEMLTKNQRTYQLLVENGIVLTLLQANCLFNAEGGYNTERPKQCSVMAKFVYLLDEMSANVKDRSDKGFMVHYKYDTKIGRTATHPDD